ncbi:MAG: response regulator [Candidatus Ryanbacteria bacterium CG10_big_fil_rev_8_21_14_0_10_43_42]|uniref:Response regulator n=1 Tax=Candidatus Ryanbacteria bacterium CG10_big_fil_rev_8_21_14_0_10_43_42 TaxID=1974864 RepID=A0A2M8KX98_9BACT|nr:MAG: response regulator [Candidatus Ryanbacteria bacterium CG10_big_fil_rev_8_21_14_0_10_43_42]
MDAKKKILLIDDDMAMGKTLSDYLGKIGYEVHSALDGEKGFAEAKDWMPDIILLDMIMPVMNGMETLKALREDPQTEKLPVIILTNVEMPEEVSEVMQMGSVYYLIKANYSMEDIEKKIKSVLAE